MTLIDTRTPDAKRLIPGATGDWEIIIGLEVHAQITSEAKLFSGASTAFGAAPNANVSLVDAAMPGMLPVINEECVKQAIRTGLGLKAQINHKSVFDRKNYFYPDLPQGYQISQFKQPIVGEGTVIVSVGPDRQGEFEDIEVGIERLHLEQDAGKSMHDQHPTMSYVDLNRSGVALMEIVSKPDMRSADEAKAYVTKLRTIVRYLGTCDGRPSTMRRAGRSPSWRMAARSTRKRDCSTPSRARHVRCAPRKRRMTTAISPTRTSCRWNSTRPMSTRWLGNCPNCPTTRRRG